jgi:hypothetical protein
MKALKRLLRRWFIPRREYDQTHAALKTALGLLVRHHEVGVRQTWGCFCPVCHHKDGTEPEIDTIIDALKQCNDVLGKDHYGH